MWEEYKGKRERGNKGGCGRGRGERTGEGVGVGAETDRLNE